MPEFLFEIGCEEIPAPWLAGLTDQLAKRFAEAATREHLAPTEVRGRSTPRRLVLTAGVAARQADREEAVWGPSLKVARDAAGAWTTAALGFARKNGVDAQELQQAPKDPAKPAEINLLYTRRIAGRPAQEVLPGVIASVLRGLAFPKRMSWDAWIEDGKGAFPFGRPIRWLVALLDGAVVPFTIDLLVNGARGGVAVRSGRRSYGHRFLPRDAKDRGFDVASYTELESGLRERFVLLAATERAARLQAGLAAAGAPAHPLAEEWRDLVEYPTVVVGEIPQEFERLPAAVLETVLVHHQKYVPIESGGRVARFAAVINTDASAAAEIVRGMQRVVVARLRDGAFFYDEDRKRPLSERVGDLEGVTFHQGLGTYRDKAARMEKLVEALGGSAAALEAARLAKADLTTLMVREFPELQGVMGGIYLRTAGGAEDVARAVASHYAPVAVEQDAPPSLAEVGPAFAAVSLADKLDTLAGYFSLGLVPTGSSDPYGLRRAGQGAIRVLLDFTGPADSFPTLPELVTTAVSLYADRSKRPADEVAADLRGFLQERLRAVLHARGFPADEVDAVLGAREPDPLDDPRECQRRLEALHSVRQEAREDFEHLAVAFKRAKNILGQAAPAAVDPARFTEPAERALFAAVQQREAGADGSVAQLRALAGLRGPVDTFFNDVLVMAEDPLVRGNRLGLLARVLTLFYRVADISKLGGTS